MLQKINAMNTLHNSIYMSARHDIYYFVYITNNFELAYKSIILFKYIPRYNARRYSNYKICNPQNISIY